MTHKHHEAFCLILYLSVFLSRDVKGQIFRSMRDAFQKSKATMKER
jgi:hypothetical protein